MLEISGQLKQVITTVSEDKNIDQSIIVEALEQAMIQAARKFYGATADLEAHYNEETDEIEVFQFRTVVEDDDVADEQIEIELTEATKLDPESVLGDSIGIKIETKELGRIAAQSAKQIIVQKVRDAERLQIYDEYKDRTGEVLSGYIRRIERGNLIIDLGLHEAVMPIKEQLPTERFRIKDRIQGLVIEVRKSSRGPQIVLSRAHPGYLVSLFEQAVTEIYDGIVTIESAARDPGYRSKIAVHSKDPSVDPVGACIGMKGQRVQTVIQELNGEQIDVIQYDPDPARMVCNALSPAMVSKVIVDEDSRSMEVIVAEDQLSLAIGKRGQNVKLAAQLIGWRLDIKSEAKLEREMETIKLMIESIDGLEKMQASVLVNEGITSPEDIVALGERALDRILNIGEEAAQNVIESAKNFDYKAFEEKQASDLKAAQAAAIEEELFASASAAPEETKVEEAASEQDDDSGERLALFTSVPGVGEAQGAALASAGYQTLGDILADSEEEMSNKTDLPLAICKTLHVAIDRYLQEQRGVEASDIYED